MARGALEVDVEGRRLRLSNLDKVLYPEVGFTKGQVIDYYTRIAPVLLPHLAGRALTRKRYPDGVEGQVFFEKNAPRGTPEWVRTVTLPTPGSSKGRETIDYVVVDDLPTLVWTANLASLELHTHMWRVDGSGADPDQCPPDMVVFDLDPGPPASIVECCRVALLLLPLLAACGERTPTPDAGATPSRSPVGVSTLARSPVVPVSPSQATSVQPTVTPATPATPDPTATMAAGATDPCGAVAEGSGDRPVVSNASVAAASRVSLLYFRGRTYVGNGDPSYGPDGTRLATPRYVVDRPIGKTFSRWQSGGQFPAGSAVYSVAGEPVERLVAVKGPDRTWLFRHYPDDLLYSL